MLVSFLLVLEHLVVYLVVWLLWLWLFIWLFMDQSCRLKKCIIHWKSSCEQPFVMHIAHLIWKYNWTIFFWWTQFAIGSRLWSKSTLNLFYKHNSQLVASCDAHLIWVKSNNHQKKWTIVYFECVWILSASFFPQYWSEPLFLKPKKNSRQKWEM